MNKVMMIRDADRKFLFYIVILIYIMSIWLLINKYKNNKIDAANQLERNNILSKLNYLGDFNHISDCSTHKIQCLTDNDCKYYCSNKTPFSCFNKLCIPKSSPVTQSCNTNNGGRLVLIDHKQSVGISTFECTCLFKEYFTGPSCDEIESNVCKGGTFDYQAIRVNKGIPLPIHCKCAADKVRISVRSSAGTRHVPYCVSLNQYKILMRSGMEHAIKKI
jgi:Per os infectivity factor 3